MIAIDGAAPAAVCAFSSAHLTPRLCLNPARLLFFFTHPLISLSCATSLCTFSRSPPCVDERHAFSFFWSTQASRLFASISRVPAPNCPASRISSFFCIQGFNVINTNLGPSQTIARADRSETNRLGACRHETQRLERFRRSQSTRKNSKKLKCVMFYIDKCNR